MSNLDEVKISSVYSWKDNEAAPILGKIHSNLQN